MPSPQDHVNALEDAIRPRGRLITAYSGGVDSTVVAVMARRVLGKVKAPAVIGDSPSLPRREFDAAVALAESQDLDVVVVKPGEAQDAGYQRNAGDRCYFCKTHLYESLHQLARERGFAFLANGTNVDDLGDHRPGLRAADEAEVVSPLVEAKLDKSAVRDVARHLGLPNADKPAAACLASRIPYGTQVTPENLAQVERAEAAMQDLGFTGLRVRHHDPVARLEVPVNQLGRLMEPGLRERVVRELKAAGYTYITLDLEGFRSGSSNDLLRVTVGSSL